MTIDEIANPSGFEDAKSEPPQIHIQKPEKNGTSSPTEIEKWDVMINTKVDFRFNILWAAAWATWKVRVWDKVKWFLLGLMNVGSILIGWYIRG